MGNNLDYEGLKKTLTGLDPTWNKHKPEGMSKEETTKEWSRLKAFMGGKR